MSPARRHRLTFFFFLPSARCRVAMHLSRKVAGVPSSARCRAAALPGERGRTRGSRAGGVAHGVGSAAGSALASPPPRFLPAPGRAGRPRGWEAAVLQARSHREPDHLAELPSRGRDRSLRSLPTAGAGAGRVGK